MIPLAIAAVAVGVATVAAVVKWGFWRRLEAEFVLVGLFSGATFDGVRVARDRETITLSNARAFDAEGRPVTMGGNVTLERQHIEFVQSKHRRE